MKQFLNVVIVLAVIGLVTFSCSEASGPDIPDTGTVSGTVTFVGNWPAVGDIQISIYPPLSPPYVPMGAPEYFTDPLDSGLTSFNFSFEGVEKSEYGAIFVGWRDPANPAGSQLIGMYWNDPTSSGINPGSGLPLAPPTTFTISDENIDVSGINITADLGLIR